jgi:hypothetical protein
VVKRVDDKKVNESNLSINQPRVFLESTIVLIHEATTAWTLIAIKEW